MKRHTLTTRIGRIGILRSVIVPSPIAKVLGSATHIPVIARYAGEITRSTLAPAGRGKRRLVLQMSVLRPAGLDAGDMIEISLEPAAESHKQPLPADLARAVQFRPAAAAELDRSAPSTWRMIIERLEQARTPETRQQRVERIAERLAEMAAARAKKKGPKMLNPEGTKANAHRRFADDGFIKHRNATANGRRRGPADVLAAGTPRGEGRSDDGAASRVKL